MDNKKIYDLLNDVETDYIDEKLSDEKISDLKKKFNLNDKKTYFSRITKIAASLVLVSSILLTNPNVRAEISSFVETFFTEQKVNLQEANDLPENINKYTVNLHENVTLNHISFVIEDVAIDGRYGYLNLIYPEKYSSRYEKNNGFTYFISNIYINGENYLLKSSSSHEEKIGSGLISDVREFKVENEMPKTDEIKLGIEFAEFSNIDDKTLVELNISMDKLTKDSKTYLEEFTIPNTQKYKISKMIINFLKPRIETNEDVGGDLYSVKRFVGEDKTGRKIVFELEEFFTDNKKKKTAMYRFVPKDDKDSENKSDFSIEELNNFTGKVTFQMYDEIYSKSFTGKLKYDENGKVISKIEKIGDSFAVDFK